MYTYIHMSFSPVLSPHVVGQVRYGKGAKGASASAGSRA